MIRATCSRVWRHGNLSQKWLRLRSVRANSVVTVDPPLPAFSGRLLATTSKLGDVEPFRKALKDKKKFEQHEKRKAARDDQSNELRRANSEDPESWELTIGLEIHAQLNTETKLFSDARTSTDAEPNTNVAVFDLAFPGTQPIFQKATLIPALRAALALNCEIQTRSTFDRKHYFYQDQPAGYQITQYYSPYAKNGTIILNEQDGFRPGQEFPVEIKQVQMEQDTAKSIKTDEDLSLIDFNRAGHPLIEIITQPMIHSAAQAVAVVLKIQSLLMAVNAVTTGMEAGGLRADVNVSVAKSDTGVLGQRVEIKNLNTLQSIQAAIETESARQIEILESGGSVTGETRGWSLVEKRSRSLRGKEGEVDYRYMPDPDIPVLQIGQDLIDHIAQTMPPLPDATLSQLQEAGVTLKDAKTLIILEEGARLDYHDEVVDAWAELRRTSPLSGKSLEQPEKVVANWVLHEIGQLLSSTDPPQPFTPALIPSETLALILHAIAQDKITRSAGKTILGLLYRGDKRTVKDLLAEFQTKDISDQAYEDLATQVMTEHAQVVEDIQSKGKGGKIMFLVGQMLRKGERGALQPQKVEGVLRSRLGLVRPK